MHHNTYSPLHPMDVPSQSVRGRQQILFCAFMLIQVSMVRLPRQLTPTADPGQENKGGQLKVGGGPFQIIHPFQVIHLSVATRKFPPLFFMGGANGAGTAPLPRTPRYPGNFVRVCCSSTRTKHDQQARGPAFQLRPQVGGTRWDLNDL